ncbi:MAG: hypothetical protein DSY80_06310 [Desulfocapsa sp.]|nr:MAG: hypothetical protein DSY80_06310 [Desulfocapsa sp.]
MIPTAINLYVFAVLPDQEIVQVGRILSTNLGSPGQYEGYFKYDPAYLTHPKRYAIDPVHLPLEAITFKTPNRETGLHDIFSDSLPDAWGIHLLARKGGLERQRYAPPHLLKALQGQGIGRFIFSESEQPPQLIDASIDFEDIETAINEAGLLESSLATETAELRHLLACGTSAGGARPKVLTRKDDIHWLAKFSSKHDPHPSIFVALEEAGLTLAAQAGLNVPEFQRVAVKQRDLLLIKRFDITATAGRNAICSFKTLTGNNDPYTTCYADLAAIIRHHSYQPKHDLEQLFRQMIVNVLLINTDDHLQNFAMLHTEAGWRLSPSYDIVPNLYQPGQILQINQKHTGITKEDIILEGRKFGFSKQRARRILSDTRAQLKNWQTVFNNCRVPASHSRELQDNIAGRLTAIE